MGKIEDLISPDVEVTFRGEKYKIRSGFTLKETPIIQKAFSSENPEERAKGMMELLKNILKRLFPEATEEQMEKVDSKYIIDLLDVFYQLDETDEDEQKRIKETLLKFKEKAEKNEVKN